MFPISRIKYTCVLRHYDQSLNTPMTIRFAFLPLLLALNFSMCKKQQAVTDKPQPAGSAAPGTAAATAAPVVAATPKIKKPVVDQTAQTRSEEHTSELQSHV